MTTDNQKRIERSHLDLVISSFPEFLPGSHTISAGNPIHGEPDFIVCLQDETRVGIEHTLLEHRQRIHGRRSAELHAAPMQLARKAQGEFRRLETRSFMVNAGVGPAPYQDIQTVARFLAETVAETADPQRTVNRSVWPTQGAPIECHFAVWPEDAPREWTFSAVTETLLLDKAVVSAAIERKSSLSKLEGYRRCCDSLRLLCISTKFPAWCNFSCPDDAPQWEFVHNYDDVYVYCQENNRLLRF